MAGCPRRRYDRIAGRKGIASKPISSLSYQRGCTCFFEFINRPLSIMPTRCVRADRTLGRRRHHHAFVSGGMPPEQNC